MIPEYLLPPQYRKTYFIAGGWAACPAMAHARDVWVQASVPEVARKELLAHFRRVLDEDEWAEEQSPAYQPDGRVIDPFYDSVAFTLKVARLALTGNLYHILVTSAEVWDVIKEFDLSVHQIALTPEGGVIKGPDWTPITVPPVILKMTATTPERYVKLCERYGHPVDQKYLRSVA